MSAVGQQNAPLNRGAVIVGPRKECRCPEMRGDESLGSRRQHELLFPAHQGKRRDGVAPFTDCKDILNGISKGIWRVRLRQQARSSHPVLLVIFGAGGTAGVDNRHPWMNFPDLRGNIPSRELRSEMDVGEQDVN